jgi:hypothetical protein
MPCILVSFNLRINKTKYLFSFEKKKSQIFYCYMYNTIIIHVVSTLSNCRSVGLVGEIHTFLWETLKYMAMSTTTKDVGLVPGTCQTDKTSVIHRSLLSKSKVRSFRTEKPLCWLSMKMAVRMFYYNSYRSNILCIFLLFCVKSFSNPFPCENPLKFPCIHFSMYYINM